MEAITQHETSIVDNNNINDNNSNTTTIGMY